MDSSELSAPVVILQSSEVRQIHLRELKCVFYAHEACAPLPLNHGRHTPFLSLHQVHGVLDLYPAALAHPCGMPCIFKQVLHFEISSRRDISRRLNISGSRTRQQPSQRKYQPAPHQAARGVSRRAAQLSARLHPSPFWSGSGPSPLGSPRSAEPLHASHTSAGLQPDGCRDTVNLTCRTFQLKGPLTLRTGRLMIDAR